MENQHGASETGTLTGTTSTQMIDGKTMETCRIPIRTSVVTMKMNTEDTVSETIEKSGTRKQKDNNQAKDYVIKDKGFSLFKSILLSFVT